MKRAGIVALMTLGGMVGTSFAGPTGDLCKYRLAKGTPVVAGEWHAGLEETKKYAEENGLPLMAVWSNGDSCGHCTKFENDVNSEPFRTFMAKSGIVYMFAHSGDAKPDGPEGGDTHKWCSKNWATKAYPYVRFYWKKGGKVLVDKNVTGDTVDGSKGRYTGSKTTKKPGYPDFIEDGATDYDTYNPGGRYSAWYITNGVSGVFRDYMPEPVITYAGGQFAVESVVATNNVTKSLDLKMVRDDAVKALVATNWIVFSLDGQAVTNQAPIVWGLGGPEAEKVFSYDFGMSGIDSGVTNIYTVSLLDDAKTVKSTMTITAVPYPYYGAEFTAGSGDCSALEVVTGLTTRVSIPLARRNASQPATNRLVAKYRAYDKGLGKYVDVVVTNEVNFVGERELIVELELPKGLAAAGIELMLLDETGRTAATSLIRTLEEEPENSPANPRWIGERTAETLAWGEWTMDFDAATQKVAAVEGDAYTLILVGGSKWCPDCVKTDRNLLDTQGFKTWADKHKVSCVVVDLPKVTADDPDHPAATLIRESPSLLSYEPVSVSERYVDACGEGEASRVQSGAGYLSRHGVPLTGNGGTNATEVAKRNASLFMTSTCEGGLCRPDCLDVTNEKTMQFKTGIPCLIVMDKSGRIIGRNFQFNNESPEEFKPCYIERLNELLAQEKDLSEEKNDSRQTTEDTLPLRGNTGVGDVAKSISYNDVNDWYRISTNALNAKVEYQLKGDVDAEVRLSVVQVTATGEHVLTNVIGSLKTGLTVGVEKIPSTNCFVCVSAPLTKSSWGVTYGYFALTNESSTVAEYVLKSNLVLSPTEVKQKFDVAPGEDMEVVVAVEKGRNYRFEGEDTISDNRLAYNAEGGFYVASETCDVSIPLCQSTFRYQIWNPGVVAFSSAQCKVKEPATGITTNKFIVCRLGGVSGAARVRIAVDQSRSTQLEDTYLFADDGKVLVWEEGDAADKELSVEVLANTFADGDQRVILVLSAEEDSAAMVGVNNEYELTLADDNDPSIPGKVEICGTVPAKGGTCVYAKAGTDVTIQLDRIGGANGTVGCSLASTAGTLEASAFSWPSRDVSTKSTKLSLADIGAGTLVTVTMTPNAGTKAVTSARSVKVSVVSADAPEFSTERVDWTVFKNVSITDLVESIDIRGGEGAVSVTKISGSIPGGIKAIYDSNEKKLRFAGVPTAKAGQYEAVYRVSAGGVKGLAVMVSFRVIDPVATSTQTGTALNEACAKTRTFSDLQVFSDKDWSKLIGLVTLTVPPSGRLSAKYVCASGTVSLLSKNWSSIQSTGGALTAELVGSTVATKGYQMTVTAFSDGSLTCFFRDPAYHDEALSILRPGADWQKLENGASDWQGYYTASLAMRTNGWGEANGPCSAGDGYMTFKMNTSSAIGKGVMSYAGLLPNGKAFSGSRTLWGYYDEELKKMVMAYVPVFAVSSSDDVSGLVLIEPGAAKEDPSCRGRYIYSDKNTYELFNTNKFVWISKEGVKAGLAYEAEFDVYGGYYSSEDDFAGSCSTVFSRTDLTFFAMTERCPLTLGIWSTNDTAVSVKRVNRKNSIKLVKERNDQNLTLSFSLSTGVVSGSMDFKDAFGATVKAVYKGVVMPGWGSASCEECSWGGQTEQRPFVSGACWFTKTVPYFDAKERERKVSVKYGCPFSIGIEAGR